MTATKKRTSRKRSPYSKDFTPNYSTAKRYLLDHIPAPLWIAARAQAKREGKSMRALLLGFLTTYTATTEDRS